ncbi:MAG: TetR/AcrR family transcriptional regulator [Microbacterium sp.]|uniref:TetR/AcrR family transcriptional regulator n=1 Tax=Microbacterium sp. TaxID=51671 RepID=UPI0039E4F6E4
MPPRQRDAERTRAELLSVATEVFAADGYSGARVDEIAERTRTTKRMIYYYFGSKEGLYLAVLENAYLGIREAERRIDVDHTDPVEAVRQLAELTFDHHVTHDDFIRLVAIENVHRGEFIRRIETLRQLAQPAKTLLDEILDRGRDAGVFRDDVDAIDVHLVISAYCVFQVANRYTFGYLFDMDFADPARRAHLRALIGEVVVGWLTSAAR